MEGINADYQLLIDIRNFQISPTMLDTAGADSATPTAHVAFAAKIIGENGKIIGSRTFDAMVPAKTNAAGAAAALNQAFGKAAADLVLWTQGVI
jgi:phospholipid/cholesterol/gamma-HCH transport system substrate-binding protein